uniref:RNA helicase n=1 Tax=Nicotiana tabacum TaxID=4097 RepID=A0A1S4BKB6_TOBAC|nr:pre-mRNA-splicing factor ATP-dependent RNA helicase DEAH10-like isoform X1 [Nicotiana tomentosiformis]XP_016489290.1 PREDICTED: pre-mRNA-splicing factor ATP-dependent RNA helicase DEAH10-like [Nicotiana tabacum]
MDSTELFTGETSATNPKAPSMKQKIEQQRKNLPIAAVERRLVEEVRNNDTLIIVGETGSGKTTRKYFATRPLGLSDMHLKQNHLLCTTLNDTSTKVVIYDVS